MKPVNLQALCKWVGFYPQHLVDIIPNIAPMLRRLGYDPMANPPKYDQPDPRIANNTLHVIQHKKMMRNKGLARWTTDTVRHRPSATDWTNIHKMVLSGASIPLWEFILVFHIGMFTWPTNASKNGIRLIGALGTFLRGLWLFGICLPPRFLISMKLSILIQCHKFFFSMHNHEDENSGLSFSDLFLLTFYSNVF